MPQMPSRLDETRQWLDYSKRYLKAAEILLSTDSATEMNALFHCQQGVEKALKAFLLWHDRPFAKTHDLRRLAHQFVEIDRSLEPQLLNALPLTDFATRFRYPGISYRPEAGEAESWLAVARTACSEILKRLPEEAWPPAS